MWTRKIALAILFEIFTLEEIIGILRWTFKNVHYVVCTLCWQKYAGKLKNNTYGSISYNVFYIMYIAWFNRELVIKIILWNV